MNVKGRPRPFSDVTILCNRPLAYLEVSMASMYATGMINGFYPKILLTSILNKHERS